jgi:hypothetical protein
VLEPGIDTRPRTSGARAAVGGELDGGGEGRPHVDLLALDGEQDVGVGRVAGDQLELRAGEFLQQQREVVRVRSRTGGADHQLAVGLLQLSQLL